MLFLAILAAFDAFSSDAMSFVVKNAGFGWLKMSASGSSFGSRSAFVSGPPLWFRSAYALQSRCSLV